MNEDGSWNVGFKKASKLSELFKQDKEDDKEPSKPNIWFQVLENILWFCGQSGKISKYHANSFYIDLSVKDANVRYEINLPKDYDSELKILAGDVVVPTGEDQSMRFTTKVEQNRLILHCKGK